jgi:hypothetical protein
LNPYDGFRKRWELKALIAQILGESLDETETDGVSRS